MGLTNTAFSYQEGVIYENNLNDTFILTGRFSGHAVLRRCRDNYPMLYLNNGNSVSALDQTTIVKSYTRDEYPEMFL